MPYGYKDEPFYHNVWRDLKRIWATKTDLYEKYPNEHHIRDPPEYLENLMKKPEGTGKYKLTYSKNPIVAWFERKSDEFWHLTEKDMDDIFVERKPMNRAAIKFSEENHPYAAKLGKDGKPII